MSKPKKKRSVFDRCFTAATRWMAIRYGDYGYTEGDAKHVAYRCGWANGYQAARRDFVQGKKND